MRSHFFTLAALLTPLPLDKDNAEAFFLINGFVFLILSLLPAMAICWTNHPLMPCENDSRLVDILIVHHCHLAIFSPCS